MSDEKKFIKTNKNTLSRMKKQKNQIQKRSTYNVPLDMNSNSYVATALYDYVGDPLQSQLSFQKGDNITISSSHSNGWSYGFFNNTVGYLPTSYVTSNNPSEPEKFNNGKFSTSSPNIPIKRESTLTVNDSPTNNISNNPTITKSRSGNTPPSNRNIIKKNLIPIDDTNANILEKKEIKQNLQIRFIENTSPKESNKNINNLSNEESNKVSPSFSSEVESKFSSKEDASNDTNTNESSNNDSDNSTSDKEKRKKRDSSSNEFHSINSNPFEINKKNPKNKIPNFKRSQSNLNEELDLSGILNSKLQQPIDYMEMEINSPKLSIEPEIIPGNECVIMGFNGENFISGTLKKVVEWLIFKEKLQENKENFLLCYREKFVSPKKLLDCLIIIYKSYRFPNNKDQLLQFISFWIARHYERDWCGNNKMLDRLLSFMKSNFIAKENLVLINTLKLDLVKYEKERQKTSRNNVVNNKVLFTINSNEAFFQYIKLNSKVIAEQITKLCFYLFTQLKPSDMFCKGGNISKNMELFCSHSLEISAWILQSFEISQKRKHPSILKKFIKVSDYLYKLRNFNSLFSIINTLSSEKIQSLAAWQSVSKSYMQKYSKYEKLVSPTFSFQNYKDTLSNVIGNSISLRPPILPYFAINMKSIRYIDKTIDSFIAENGFINYKKVQLIGSILREIGSFQKKLYSIERVDTVYDFFAGLREYFANSTYLKDVKSYFTLDGDDIISSKYDCKQEGFVVKRNPMYGASPSKIDRVKTLQGAISSGSSKDKEKELSKFIDIKYFLENDSGNKRISLAFGSINSSRSYKDDSLKGGISAWSKEKIDEWLLSLGMGEYSKNFLNHSIRGDQLAMLNDNDLKMLGVSKLGHRKKIIKEIRSYGDENVGEEIPNNTNNQIDENNVVIPRLNFGDTHNNLTAIFKRRNSSEMDGNSSYREKDFDNQELRTYGLSPRNIDTPSARKHYTNRTVIIVPEESKDDIPKNSQSIPLERKEVTVTSPETPAKGFNIFSDDDYEEEKDLQDTNEIWIKGYYKNECRLLRIKKDIEIAQLEKKFAKEFKKRIKFSIKFKDTEGDFISITKKTDLQYAILNSEGIIKLHLF